MVDAYSCSQPFPLRLAPSTTESLPGLISKNLVTSSQGAAPQGERGVVAVTVMVSVEERRVHGAIYGQAYPLSVGIVHRTHAPGPSPRAGTTQHEPLFRNAQRAILCHGEACVVPAALALHFLTLVFRPDTHWRSVLPPDEGSGPQWTSLYKGVLPLYIGDLGWRVLHKAVACNRYLSWFPHLSAACHFYGEEETVFHVYMECSRLQPLFENLKGLLLKFWIHFSPTLLFFGHPVQRGDGREGREGGGVSLSVCSWAWHRWPFAGPGSGQSTAAQRSAACPLPGLRLCPHVPAEGTRGVHGDSGGLP